MSGSEVVILYKKKADGALMIFELRRSMYPDQELFKRDLDYFDSDGYYKNKADALSTF